MNALNTIQDEWARYRDVCYPGGLEPIQDREVQQAFFAGAMVVCTRMIENANLPGKIQSNAFRAMDEEIKAFHRASIEGRGGPLP